MRYTWPSRAVDNRAGRSATQQLERCTKHGGLAHSLGRSVDVHLWRRACPLCREYNDKHMCMCVFVCLVGFVCVCVCVCVWVYVLRVLWMFLYLKGVRLCVYLCMFICFCLCVYFCACGGMFTCVFVCICTCDFAYLLLPTCMMWHKVNFFQMILTWMNSIFSFSHNTA